ncbi:MAG: tRNA glutamyl-Q(34) synthetase GluQRS [Hyphomicrobium sp.]
MTRLQEPAQPVLRFAPSPNGALHLGHALSALTGFELARRLGGRFLVRIEDIDQTRVRPEYISGIFEDLAWLGVAFEQPVLFQSHHLADYKRAAAKLDDMGLLYPCFASRKEIVAAADPKKLDPEGALVYPGIWRGRSQEDVRREIAKGEPFAMRLDMESAVALARNKLGGPPITFTEIDRVGRSRIVVCDPLRWGDVVVLRKETPSSYLISVVVDDARQGITHVTRGMDLFAATDAQRVLQILLDLPTPLYHHHRLIVDGLGQKLSKSTGAQSLASLRAAGVTADEVLRLIGSDALAASSG